MPKKISGNKLTSKEVQLLKKSDEIIITFSPFEKSTGYSERVESELRRRYGTDGMEPDYGGNRFRYEGDKIRCRSHDCGDTSCRGLGETYYVSGEELQEIAKN